MLMYLLQAVSTPQMLFSAKDVMPKKLAFNEKRLNDLVTQDAVLLQLD